MLKIINDVCLVLRALREEANGVVDSRLIDSADEMLEELDNLAPQDKVLGNRNLQVKPQMEAAYEAGKVRDMTFEEYYQLHYDVDNHIEDKPLIRAAIGCAMLLDTIEDLKEFHGVSQKHFINATKRDINAAYDRCLELVNREYLGVDMTNIHTQDGLAILAQPIEKVADIMGKIIFSTKAADTAHLISDLDYIRKKYDANSIREESVKD